MTVLLKQPLPFTDVSSNSRLSTKFDTSYSFHILVHTLFYTFIDTNAGFYFWLISTVITSHKGQAYKQVCGPVEEVLNQKGKRTQP